MIIIHSYYLLRYRWCNITVEKCFIHYLQTKETIETVDLLKIEPNCDYIVDSWVMGTFDLTHLPNSCLWIKSIIVLRYFFENDTNFYHILSVPELTRWRSCKTNHSDAHIQFIYLYIDLILMIMNKKIQSSTHDTHTCWPITIVSENVRLSFL